jgi:transcription factor MYB, plant
MAHLLDDDVIEVPPPTPSNAADSSESSSTPFYSTATPASSGSDSNVVDGEWPDWSQMMEWPEAESMWLDDVVTGPAQWEFEDTFVPYQRIALFDHQETWNGSNHELFRIRSPSHSL